ncbi:hypothetical protein, partial [Methylobacterium radiotolerans]|uniref:hypothetical protein n=1 Tax=Methylobacterium radiotolerans TaxID=31998 RepID=UPI001AECB7BB
GCVGVGCGVVCWVCLGRMEMNGSTWKSIRCGVKTNRTKISVGKEIYVQNEDSRMAVYLNRETSRGRT